MADYEQDDLQQALFRMYSTKPYYRRACLISYAPETEDKYRLTQVDPQVCDTGFMASINRVMATPQRIRESVVTKTGIQQVIKPDPTVVGTEEHFVLAVEVIPASINVEPTRMVI